METLDLDEGRQQAVNYVFEQTMTQVLQHLARERALLRNGAIHNSTQAAIHHAKMSQNLLNESNEFTHTIDGYVSQALYILEGTTSAGVFCY